MFLLLHSGSFEVPKEKLADSFGAAFLDPAAQQKFILDVLESIGAIKDSTVDKKILIAFQSFYANMVTATVGEVENARKTLPEGTFQQAIGTIKQGIKDAMPLKVLLGVANGLLPTQSILSLASNVVTTLQDTLDARRGLGVLPPSLDQPARIRELQEELQQARNSIEALVTPEALLDRVIGTVHNMVPTESILERASRLVGLLQGPLCRFSLVPVPAPLDQPSHIRGLEADLQEAHDRIERLETQVGPDAKKMVELMELCDDYKSIVHDQLLPQLREQVTQLQEFQDREDARAREREREQEELFERSRQHLDQGGGDYFGEGNDNIAQHGDDDGVPGGDGVSNN